MHLNLQNAVALAGFAPAALDVEGKPAAVIAARLGFGSLCKQLSNIGEYAGVGGRVGARRSSNRTLADFDDLIQLLDAYDFLVLAGTRLCLIEFCCQPFIEDFIDKGRFSRAGHAGHCRKGSQRDAGVDLFQVVLLRTLDGQPFSVALPSGCRHRNKLFAAEILSGHRAVTRHDFLQGACAHHLAAVYTRSRSDVHDIVGGVHGILIVFDHDDGVAQVTQMAQGGNQLVVVPLMQSDARLVQNI